MTDASERPSRGRMIAVLIVAVVIVVGVIIAIVFATRGGQMPTGSDTPAPTSTQTQTTAPTDGDDAGEDGDNVEISATPGPVLKERKGGQEAIDALGDKIEVVAKRNGKTVDELKDLLLRDKTAQVSPEGFIVYVDNFGNEG